MTPMTPDPAGPEPKQGVCVCGHSWPAHAWGECAGTDCACSEFAPPPSPPVTPDPILPPLSEMREMTAEEAADFKQCEAATFRPVQVPPSPPGAAPIETVTGASFPKLPTLDANPPGAIDWVEAETKWPEPQGEFGHRYYGPPGAAKGCTCGHGQNEHAYPGAAGTPCARCSCGRFNQATTPLPPTPPPATEEREDTVALIEALRKAREVRGWLVPMESHEYLRLLEQFYEAKALLVPPPASADARGMDSEDRENVEVLLDQLVRDSLLEPDDDKVGYGPSRQAILAHIAGLESRLAASEAAREEACDAAFLAGAEQSSEQCEARMADLEAQVTAERQRAEKAERELADAKSRECPNRFEHPV